MKIEPGNNEYFLIDSTPIQRGTVKIFRNTTRVGFKAHDGKFIENSETKVINELGTFTDENDDEFLTIQAFVDYVKDFIFTKVV